mmetsp:Transcript_5572/g.9245  ORF Transcript_5572/g.9245 Transcript_5572/m.9245 type:complete len:614 (-) Transcript_5572:167-2008(-)
MEKCALIENQNANPNAFTTPRDSRDWEREPFLGLEQEAPIKKEPVEAESQGWMETLRPHTGGPLTLQIWQKFCPFIPMLAFCIWSVLLLFFLIKRPIYAVVLCDINMIWGIFEHSRWAIFGIVAMRRVLAGAEDREDILSTQHACFIATYKEDVEVLRQTLLSLSNQKGKGLRGQTFARSFIGVNLCYEVREGKLGQEQAALLIEEFKDRFAWMTATFHPPDIPGDLMGKCSNVRWSIAQSRLQKTPSALVTVVDADSQFDLRYFSEVSAKYEKEGISKCSATIFQPTILHFRNFYDQGGVVRSASIMTSIGNSCYMEDFVYKSLPYSTFTLPWDLLERISNFCPDYVADDWHVGIKSFLVDPFKARVIHMPLPIVNYAVEADSCAGELKERWKQAVRHALGLEEIGYILQMMPACIARQKAEAAAQADQQQSVCSKSCTESCNIIEICCRCWRILCFMLCVHIRLAFVIPEQITMMALGAGILNSVLHPEAVDGWPLYGEAPHHFLTRISCILNFGFTQCLLICCVVVTLTSVRTVRHLTEAGRVTSEVPWWAKTPFQYIYDLTTMFWSLPVMYLCAAAAEVRAFFTTPFLDKKAFVYHVATKPQLSMVQGA